MREDENSGWEYATLARNDGTPTPRTQALKSFEKYKQALARAGGRPPLDAEGDRMSWNEVKGWHRSTAPPAARGGLRLAELQRRQDRVNADLAEEARRGEQLRAMEERLHAKRQRSLAEERATARRLEQAGIELYVRASDATLEWARRFRLGFAGNRHPSLQEMEGRQLAVMLPGRPPLEAQQKRRDRVDCERFSR